MTNRRISLLLILFLICIFSPLQAFAEAVCDPLSVYIDQGKTFILSNAFEEISKIFCDLANASWAVFRFALVPLVALGCAIYIAMYTLKNLGSFSIQDVSAYLGKVIPVFLKAAFIIFLLYHPEDVYKWLVAPIIEVGAVFSSTGGSEITSAELSFKNTEDLRGLFNIVINKAETFNNKAYEIVAMGRLMFCAMLLPDGIFDWFWSLLPFGATLFIFGWLIIIGVSFYMLDILFRLGVGCIILPLSLPCALSKLTIQYTKSTWGLFVNVAFSFIMLNIVITFAIKMIEKSVLGIAEDAMENALTGGLLALINNTAVTEAVAKILVEQLCLKGFILMSLSCLIAFKLCMQVDGIVQKVSGEKIKGDLAQKIGGSATKMAENALKAPAKQIQKFSGALAKETSETVGGAIGRTGTMLALRNLRRRGRAWVKRNIFRLKD